MMGAWTMGVAEGRQTMGAADNIATHDGGAGRWAPRTILPRTMGRRTMANGGADD